MRRLPTSYKDIPSEVADEIVTLFDEGSSVSALARRFDDSRGNVTRLLKSRGRDTAKGHKSGADHHAYRGGKKVVNEAGYLISWNSETRQYDLEHRVVMASMLGRELERWETVHHIDGDRMNNDPSNLQLRIGRHGPGVVYHCACCGSKKIVPTHLD